MKNAIILAPLLLLLLVSCNNNKDAAAIYEDLKSILPISAQGSSLVGEVRGKANFFLGKDNSVTVQYTALDMSAEEVGELNDFVLKNIPGDDCYQLEAIWKNKDSKSGSGVFVIKNNGINIPNSISIQVNGASWSYNASVQLSFESYQKCKELLRKTAGDGVSIDDGKNTQNSSENFSNDEKSLELKRKTEELEQMKKALEEANKRRNSISSVDLSRLCGNNYISTTFGTQEILNFGPRNYGCELVYSNTKYSSLAMQFSGDAMWFTKNPNKKYVVRNISADNGSFDLLNPDGTVQTYRTIKNTNYNHPDEYVVISQKSFFYHAPNYETQQSAFLVNGDRCFALKYEGNFIYIEFINRYNGKSTSGWISLDDLQLQN